MVKFLRYSRWLGIGVVVFFGLTLLALWQPVTTAAPAKPTPTAKALSQPTTKPRAKISGLVVDANGPVAGAHVQLHLTEASATTAADGSFTLRNVEASSGVTITAWAEGYYIAWTHVPAADEPIRLELHPYYTSDNIKYNWFEQDGVEGSAACGMCHTAYKEWQQDAHAQTAINYRFQTMYAGTDIHGNSSPPTRYDSDGKMTPPDLNQPYYGPGFRLDNPSRAGSCAACHTPMAAKLPTNDGCTWSGCHSSTTAQYSDLIGDGVSPLYLIKDAAEGIACEFCHKIGAVRLDEKTGLPYEDSPGILSLQLHRPEQGEDLFFGPVVDVLRTDLKTPRDSYLPLQTQSSFCASCHYGILGGVVGNMKVTGGVLVYGSYAEWLASPYSDPKTGKTCQDCHMPATANNFFVFPEKGGQRRDHYPVSSHRMPGTNDEQLLQHAVTMTGTVQVASDGLRVAVSITNDQTGHSVPTDSPLRHLLLVVQAKDSNGRPLRLQNGDTLPAWAGDYAGQPGRYFAKVLRDKATGEMPTGAYWREIELVEDTRIAALATDTSTYTFAAPVKGAAKIEVQLIYRRAYQQLMEWKAWPDTDIVMARTTLTANVPAR